MIPNNWMRFSKVTKVLILCIHISIVVPFAILWFSLVALLEALKEICCEIISALKSLPIDCYNFVKYSSIQEKRKAEWSKMTFSCPEEKNIEEIL